MGLSASQARLLTLTQRINNNEYESQTISNAKVRLSTRNTIATEKYIAALDGTDMQYVSYSDAGTCETIALTFNSLMTYSSLKNQYNLYNSQGQLMVSEEDAYKFETTNSLTEFLESYGLFGKNGDGRAEYLKLLDEYEKSMNGYTDENGVVHLSYSDQLQGYKNKLDYEKKYAKYLKDKEILDTYGLPYDTFMNVTCENGHPKSGGCYEAVKKYPFDWCYLHVLGHLLNIDDDPVTFTTSTGQSVEVSKQDQYNPDGALGALSADPSKLESTRNAILHQENAEYYLKCDGDDDLTTGGKQNSLQKIIDSGREPTKIEQLLSDYIYDEATNTATEVKSLAQKTIDLDYLSKAIRTYFLTKYADTGDSNDIRRTYMRDPSITSINLTFEDGTTETLKKVDMGNALVNFTEGDLKNLNPQAPTLPTLLYDEHPGPEPVKPTLEFYTYDKEKTQWYTNLWYAMDGQEQTGKIYTTCDDNNNITHYTVKEDVKTSKLVADRNSASGKKQANQYYVIIDKANATDANWIQQMLLSGAVTMKQAALRTTGYITWEGIEFSSTTDIREVQNNTKVAKAEAEYEEAVAQIQADDKILDAKTKKLDTEHSAIKSEMESIKNVMSKNIEKSFNAFS